MKRSLAFGKEKISKRYKRNTLLIGVVLSGTGQATALSKMSFTLSITSVSAMVAKLATPQSGVIAAAGRYLDVIPFNCYHLDASSVIDAYAEGGKPCLISEFSFRGDDSGLPNTSGAGPRVASQIERAQSFERYVSAALRKPSVVGYHWFEHADQPSCGGCE